MQVKFSTLKPGDTARVAGYDGGDSGYRRKLLTMGLIPGVRFRLIRSAPLADPVEIQVNGFRLSLRRHEADMMNVEKEGGT